MDPKRFDRWTRSLHSRRAAVSALVGVGVGVTRQALAAPTPVKKSKRPSFGSIKQDNACIGADVACPDAPDGFCANDNKGKPFCYTGAGGCLPCKKNSACAALGIGPGAICVKKCPICQAQGFKSACLVPLTDA